MRLNLGSGIYTIPGFENLDKTTGWTFESGLGQYPDSSVEGISVSHALMYVHIDDWPYVFDEFARVLQPAGVLRIQEDSTADPASPRYGGYHDAVTLTTPELVRDFMEDVGLSVFDVGPDETWFIDRSLIQKLHQGPPLSFAIEGVR